MRRTTFWIASTWLITLSAAAFVPASDNSSQFEGQIIVSAYDFAHIGLQNVDTKRAACDTHFRAPRELMRSGPRVRSQT